MAGRDYDFVLTGGQPVAPFLKPYKIDFLLSTDIADVQSAIDLGIAAAVISPPPSGTEPDPRKLRFCFDFDGVLASEESDRLFAETMEKAGAAEAVKVYLENETRNVNVPMKDGPFAPFLRKLAKLQATAKDTIPIEISILTARGGMALERALRTFESWGINPDNLMTFTTSRPKRVQKVEVLTIMNPDIFLDDTQKHIDLAAASTPSGKVPWPMKKPEAPAPAVKPQNNQPRP
jgi:5'-nucleotidase